MKNLLSILTASKLVFLLMAVALVVLTFLKIVEAKDFIVMCSMAFTYYFTKKAYYTEVK